MLRVRIAVLALVGCGGSEAADDSESTSTSTDVTTIASTTTSPGSSTTDPGDDVTTTTGGDGRVPLFVDPDNPCYFNDGNGIVYLTGSHTWGTNRDSGLADPPPSFDYDRFLDFAAAHDHNFFRLWTWEQPHSANENPDGETRWFAPFPWLRTGPALANDGKPAFDLAQLDDAYFERLRERVELADARGFYVSVMLFDGWDLANAYNVEDGGFPFGAGNNVNGIAIDGPGSQSLEDDRVTAFQEAYVHRVIDTVNDLDNVLWEIANETGSAAVEWQYHMIEVVRGYESTKPKQHPIGMTATDPGLDVDLHDSNADWISPAAQLLGCDGTKVILNDTDHSYDWTALRADGPDAQRKWVWRTVTIGAQPVFMDPYLEVWSDRNAPDGDAPDPYWDPIRVAMGRARSYIARLDLETAYHDGTACSTGYCMAEYGAQYLVYQDGSGAFTVAVDEGTYAYEWYDPNAGVVVETGTLDLPAGEAQMLPPFEGDAVLLLLAD